MHKTGDQIKERFGSEALRRGSSVRRDDRVNQADERPPPRNGAPLRTWFKTVGIRYLPDLICR